MNFLEKAKALMPELKETVLRPVNTPTDEWLRLGKGFTLDFGRHLAGYLTLSLDCKRADDLSPDSPLEIRFRFAERLSDFDETPYTGGMSTSWFQTELVHIDNPLAPFTLPRRYAFRYVEVIFPANQNYWVQYRDCTVTAVTSADETVPGELPEGTDPMIRQIDRVARDTLRDCMQQVFEDGPKRDRRLWLGDLYLQAKTNYYTFRNNDLVLRCLYLFAGLPHPDGCLSSAVFHEPVLRNQAWIIHDYALFFSGTLADYYRATGNLDVVRELWPTAYRQTEIAASVLDEKGLVNENYYFVDWCAPLDKSCAAQATYVAMLKEALYLAETVGTREEREALTDKIRRGSEALLSLYDESAGLFRGVTGQISVQSQMWAVLSGVLDQKTNARILRNLMDCPEAVRTVTPYAMHYFVEALFLSGMREEAVRTMKDYWGGMVRQGADTFWEVYVPDDPEASPYGSVRMNSFCHAWSCTPSYFIRKYKIQ